MDMIEILGGMLGQKAGKPGKGADVLKDIFGRSQAPASSGQKSPIPSADQIAGQSRELEDMLSVANDRYTRKQATATPKPPAEPRFPANTGRNAGPSLGSGPSRPEAVPTSQPRANTGGPAIGGSTPGRSAGVGSPAPRAPIPSSPAQRSPAHDLPAESSSAESGDRALVLLRAMINAAKADGQIDSTEQQRILERVGDRSPETIDFLRQEFARAVDVHEFALSVPLGMEQQVYLLSLITIDLDTAREAEYLGQLAASLRIPSEVRNQLHLRVGAPILS